jgi:glycosyltransferase involved in cell wall biosynthesis
MNTKTKVIKICLIAPKAYPLFNQDVKEVFGGAEVDLYHLGTELGKDKGFDITFITADYGQKQVETIKNVKIIRSLKFDENPLAGAIKIWRAMKKADTDIYMLKTASPGVPLVAVFCRLHRRSFVYRTAHQRECDGSYIKKHRVLGPLFKTSLQRAKLVFTQNDIHRRELLRTTGVKSVFIRNGHPLDNPANKDRDRILWVARSSPIKRPDLFIELADQFPSEKFTMICQQATDDNRYDQLLARARQTDNLKFVEHVPFNQMQSYFQRAKIFVLTSEGEGFPNTFIEAGRYATPILSLSVNPDNFLEKYNCGIYCSGNWDKFVDSLKFMLEENRYIGLGKNGRKYVEEHHDISKIVNEYKRLFTQLARGNSASL